MNVNVKRCVTRSLAWVALGLAAVLVMGASATEAEATVLRDLRLPDLVTQADLIVTGTVLEQRSVRPESGGHIWTDVRVQVDGVVKGEAKGEVVVRQQGGKVGDEARFVPGNARFEKGERVVLFLIAHEGFHYTVGMELGKYTIYTGREARDYVRRETSVPVARVDSKAQVVDPAHAQLGHADESYNGATLAWFLSDIATLLAQPAPSR